MVAKIFIKGLLRKRKYSVHLCIQTADYAKPVVINIPDAFMR